jgi:Mrp family chromosome partitioning ATPase
MSNIYEALEQAQREQKGAEALNVLPVSDTSGDVKKMPFRGISSRGQASNGNGISLDAEMHCLYQNIEFLLPGVPEKTLLFLGLQGGEGVSTIVREFARMASARLGKKVLILDADHHNESPQIRLDVQMNKESSGNPEDSGRADADSPWTDIWESSPAPLAAHTDLAPRGHDHSTATGAMHEIKKNYDMTLIDYSMAAALHDSMAITRKAHGVVLVVEAERTRWPVIESARNRVERNGGNIIGIVFNKRRYYIPNGLYRFLFNTGNGN